LRRFVFLTPRQKIKAKTDFENVDAGRPNRFYRSLFAEASIIFDNAEINDLAGQATELVKAKVSAICLR